jgi:hypothetical protein
MDYRHEIESIDAFILREEYRQAGMTLRGIMEHAMLDLYNRVKLNSAPDEMSELAVIEREVGQGRAVSNFTLGQLVGLYRRGNIWRQVERVLSRNLRRTLRLPWDDMNEIGNRAGHPRNQPITLTDLRFFQVNLKTMLLETGLVSERVGATCPACGVCGWKRRGRRAPGVGSR